MGDENVMGKIVPLVLPTQLDSDSSEEEIEEEAEDHTEHMCQAVSSNYITKGVTDYDATKNKDITCCEGTNMTRRKGIVVRSKILMLCVRMC